MPTTSEYSPVDRVETEPIRRKRESCSSLFRRSKAERGCKSNTSVNQTSTDSDNIDISDNPNDLRSSSSCSKPMSANEIQLYSDSMDSYDDKFVAIELEEGLEESEEEEPDESFASTHLVQEPTFESKASSTYIDSNEEFLYETKDLLPGPLKLELVHNQPENTKATFRRGQVKPTVEFCTARDTKHTTLYDATNTPNIKTELIIDGYSTSRIDCETNSKASSYMNINPLLTDEKSTFRNITAQSNGLTNRGKPQPSFRNNVQDYCDRTSKIVHLMNSSSESDPFEDAK